MNTPDFNTNFVSNKTQQSFTFVTEHDEGNDISNATRTSVANTLLHYANAANLSAVLKFDQADREDMPSMDTPWDCLIKNGTLNYHFWRRLQLGFVDSRDRDGHMYDLFCWIRCTTTRKLGIVIKIQRIDCKNDNNTILVYELNSTLPHRPTVQPIVDICKSVVNGEYLGETNEVLLLVKAKSTVSRNVFFIDLFERSIDQLEVQYISAYEGKCATLVTNSALTYFCCGVP